MHPEERGVGDERWRTRIDRTALEQLQSGTIRKAETHREGGSSFELVVCDDPEASAEVVAVLERELQDRHVNVVTVDAGSLPTTDDLHLFCALATLFPQGRKRVRAVLDGMPNVLVKRGQLDRYLHEDAAGKESPLVVMVKNMDALLVEPDGRPAPEERRKLLSRLYLGRDELPTLVPAIVLFFISQRGQEVFKQEARDMEHWMSKHRLTPAP